MSKFYAIEFDLQAASEHALVPLFNACLANAKGCAGQISRREMWLSRALDCVLEMERRKDFPIAMPVKFRRIIDGVRGKRI